MKQYDLIRKLNAIIRFTIYYSLLMYCYSRNTNYFAVPIIACFITYLMWKKNSQVQKEESITNLKNNDPQLVNLKDHNIGCSLPNKDNPFMNPMFFDVAADKELPKSCTSYDNKGIQQKIEKEFDKGLYRNYTDIFGKENSQRQFFTISARQGVPDQSAFAHWLYRTPDTCKEGNSLACLSGAGTTGVLSRSS